MKTHLIKLVNSCLETSLFLKTRKRTFFTYNIYLAIILLYSTLAGCYMSSPDPVVVHLFGHWKWEKTYNKESKVIEESSPTSFKSVNIESITLDGKYGKVFRFYTNGLKTDSLFMHDGPNNPSGIKKDKNTLHIKAFDNEGNKAIIRTTFFFSKGQYGPSKMIMNIQRNTDTYQLSADTLQTEYINIIP